ncbi:hypothetical protein BKA82DRAFT_620895 [Pisolithus tinctorius]|uniref:Uncharacterized protein n=1 Tax=Pisolithus tinctorius Marx 270 TaxID=870435 RepID=A0A0C3P784_PISTI|nr:hypothetical protein BKA82DRAFT_620895 [Pisolithus tinctorius]KIO03466.1 hypothetical protein M404DRAFT_620895 [Pisolithus tinctorius Marx 270]
MPVTPKHHVSSAPQYSPLDSVPEYKGTWTAAHILQNHNTANNSLTMPNPLKPSKNAIIYSMVDGEPYVGMPPTKPVTLPVLLYSRKSVTEPPTFNMEKVGECTYVISARGHKTREENGLLIGSIEGEAQRWYIEYIERNDAYVIAKENDRGVGWVAPSPENKEEREEERQIRVRQLIVGPSHPPYHPSNQLFRFRYED